MLRVKNIANVPVVVGLEHLRRRDGHRIRRLAVLLRPGEVKTFSESARKSIECLRNGGYLHVLKGGKA